MSQHPPYQIYTINLKARSTGHLKDMEEILGTNTNFMLGPWFEAAKALATNEEEARLYEFNACNQITLWGPDGQILDYGGKQWAGMMEDYYIPRVRPIEGFFAPREYYAFNRLSQSSSLKGIYVTEV